MRRTLMAAGVLAAMGLAGSAHAFSWEISGATAGGVAPGGGKFKIFSPVNNYFAANYGPGGNPQGAANLDQSDATAIIGAVGLSLSAKTLTYFSWSDNAGLGYIAVAMHNTSATAFTAFISGSNWLAGSAGLFSTSPLLLTGIGSGGSISVAAGETFLMVMGGYVSGAPQVTFNLNTANGPFGVEYLSYNYVASAYGIRASGSGTQTAGSGMNVATYTIPVPAPLALAGAGLAGAVAIRRWRR